MDLHEDAFEMTAMPRIWKELAIAYRNSNLKLDESLYCLEQMMIYSWFCNDSESEIQAYDELSTAYFNIGKLDMASYYHEKCQEQILEGKKTSNRALAINEIKNRNIMLNKELSIATRFESSIDKDGQPSQKMHRVVSLYNDKGTEIVKDLANYRNSSEIFDLV